MSERGKEPEQGPTRSELFRLRMKVAELEATNAGLRELLTDARELIERQRDEREQAIAKVIEELQEGE